MNRVVRFLVALLLVGGGLFILVGGALFLSRPATVAAQVPPPSKTPIDPTDVPPTDTPVPPTPTNTSAPPPTPTNTSAPPPTPTNTTAPPTATNTSAPPPPKPSATPTATQGSPAEPPQEPRPDPSCQSSVSGVVTNSAAQAVAGARVTIQGEGWSGGMLSDDKGRYGFAGLCPGSMTLQATLPGGQALPAVTIAVDGQNDQQVNLGTQAPAATVSPSPTPSATRQAAQTPTGEPGMPATGFPGWWLGAVALLVGLSLAARVGWARYTRDRMPGQE